MLIRAKIKGEVIQIYITLNMSTFAFFDFSFQYTNAFPESRKRFFASKMSNSDSPHVFSAECSALGE
jgi:hypothetical protein